MYQSVFVSIITFCVWLGPTSVRGLGDTNQLALALIAYSSIVIVQCLTLYVEMTFIVVWVHVIVIVTFIAFLIINLAISASSNMESYSIYVGLLGDPVYWFTVLLSVVGCLLPVIGMKYWWRMERPSQVDIALEEELTEVVNKRGSDAWLTQKQFCGSLCTSHCTVPWLTLLTHSSLTYFLSFFASRRTTSGAGLLSGGRLPSYDTGNTSVTHTHHVPTTKQLINNIKRTRKARKQRTEKRESRKRLIHTAGEEDDESSVQMYNNPAADDGDAEDEKGHTIRLDADDDDGSEDVEEVDLADGSSLTSIDMEEEAIDVEDEYEESEEKKGGRH